MREALRLAGQCLWIGFEGQSASADVKALLREFGAGGVVLFARNVEAPEQVAELVRELQDCARLAGHPQALLIAVDQEGGRVARLRAPWTAWPPARALGRTGSAELARRMGTALAEELRACGIQLDFAPVLDVDTNPDNPVIGDRALADDPDLVGRLGVALIEGLQGGRVAACAKHFPGHGDTALDSHHALPIVDHSRARLDEVELRPFKAALAAGVASVMPGHLLVREWDPDRPASLSPLIVDGLLRRSLGFDGLVISDDLCMQAVAARWPMEELGVLTLLAGGDVFAVCRGHDAQVRAIEGVLRAVESERLPWTTLESAARRVRRLKERFVEPYQPPDPRQARLAAGRQQSQDLAQQIARDAGLALG
jgi:beta-N-acetylhexosaminidase